MNDEPELPNDDSQLTNEIQKDEIPELRRLAVASPPQSLSRFRKRAAVMQGTKMLFESQVTGFWVVFDAFLRLLLGGGNANSKINASHGVEVRGEQA